VNRPSSIVDFVDWRLAEDLRRACFRAYYDATVSAVATGAQVLVEALGCGIVVAFRGSQEGRDWLMNAQFDLEPLCWLNGSAVAEVHHGFLKQFESVDVEVVRQVRSLCLRHPEAKIYVTGHSLGGALATLCALEFKRQGLDPDGVFTFGSPRVGNHAFAGIYNHGLRPITWNFVNEGDPVPLTPTLLMGYRDCGREVFLRRNGAVEYDPFIGWELFRDVFGIWRNWRQLQLGLIPNHSLTEYRERIASHV
jgi:hypothetical protein